MGDHACMPKRAMAEAASPRSPKHSKVDDGNDKLENVRVTRIRPLLPPACVEEMIPMSTEAERTVMRGRAEVEKILEGTDDRFMVVCGPCSIHDTQAGLEYARKLKALADKHRGELMIVMRVYFEKPRTTVGWKGLINDPDLDNSFDINKGIQKARQFLLDVNALGLPAGTEFLDTVSPQFHSDFITWGAIGARTTECQLHRELASGLSMPIGFKNGTTGNLQIAVDACKSAMHPHAFMGVTKQGLAAIIQTSGNEHGHVILRGGSETGVQYSAEWVEKVSDALTKAKVRPNVVVDCSHVIARRSIRISPRSRMTWRRRSLRVHVPWWGACWSRISTKGTSPSPTN